MSTVDTTTKIGRPASRSPPLFTSSPLAPCHAAVAAACFCFCFCPLDHPPPSTHTPPLFSLAQAAAAAALVATPAAALAGEFDLLSAPTPTATYVIDDASVLNRTTRKSLNDELAALEKATGYRLEVATVRKLEVEGDPFALGDKIIEKWYPTVAEGTNKGILLLVTAARDGAVTGGPAFLKAVGDDLIDSVVGDNLPVLAADEKYNEAVASSVKRIEAKLTGEFFFGGGWGWGWGGIRAGALARGAASDRHPHPCLSASLFPSVSLCLSVPIRLRQARARRPRPQGHHPQAHVQDQEGDRQDARRDGDHRADAAGHLGRRTHAAVLRVHVGRVRGREREREREESVGIPARGGTAPARAHKIF